jgi:arsenate reductase
MAEAFLKNVGGDYFEVYSAGITAGTLNPYVVAAMQEIGYNIEANVTKTVFDPKIAGQDYAYVFTVCQESDAEPCPIYPTKGKRINWHFMDPSKFEGSREG